MAEPTLQQVFGSNATQDATTITITKADLTGLTASGSNTAESLITAIVLKASGYLNSTNQATNTDIQITIEDSNFPQVVTRNNAQYRQTTYNVNFQSADNYTLDPDNF